VTRVLWTEGWERRVRRRVERCVEVMVGVVERRREGWSRIRRVLEEEEEEEEAAWVRIFVIFCSREVMVGGVGRRDSESRSRKWNWGEREMSRAYLPLGINFCSLHLGCWILYSSVGSWSHSWVGMVFIPKLYFQSIQRHLRERYPPTAALLNSSFQKARSRIQLTRTTDVGFMASFRAEMAKREVSQFALQPSVLVRSVRDCEGGRARYGSSVEGVRLRCEEAILVWCRGFRFSWLLVAGERLSSRSRIFSFHKSRGDMWGWSHRSRVK
jgi:hypothetical protein